MQKTLDEYKAGVLIVQVQLQKVDPPDQVIDSFRDVQAARADQERLQNEAQAYANRVVPESRGEAARVVQSAEGYRERVVNEARGAADRFNSIYTEYKKAPEVTRERMFLETMERLFAGTDKIILDPSANGSGLVSYLPLTELNRTATRPALAPQQPSTSSTPRPTNPTGAPR
jgi:membrane protease subunit HflK